MHKIEDLQYITQDSKHLSHSEQALAMFKKGVKWVQLRMKNSSREEIISTAQLIQSFANKYNGVLIINDSVEISKTVNAKAVHLGLNDMPISEARKILGNNVIIGGTANTIDDVLYQTKQGADYIGLGPFRYTNTKKNLSPIVGIEGYKKITKALKGKDCQIPIFAVGGIKNEDIQAIKETGIHGVAISSDLLNTIIKK